MAIKYEVTAVTGTYEKDGETKKRYAKLGVILKTKNGYALKLETVPVGWDGWAYLNEPEERKERKEAPRRRDEDDPDALPF